MKRSSRFNTDVSKIHSVTHRAWLSADDIGSSIFKRVECLAETIFDAYEVKNYKLRKNKFDSVLDDIEKGVINPNDDWSYEFRMVQKESYDDEINLHFEMALQQAVYAFFIWDKYLLPLKSAIFMVPNKKANKESARLFSDILTAIDHSGRHLTALYLVENLKNKSYQSRAEKGGRSRSKPHTKKERNYLLWVVFKGMLYNDPQSLKRFMDYDGTVAHDFAKRIQKANKEYQMLNIDKLDTLEVDIQTLFVERYNEISEIKTKQRSKNVNKGLVRPRLKPYTESLGLEMAKSQGRFEGLQEALIFLLKSRFGELQGQILDEIYRTDTEGLRAYLELASRAKTIDEVIPVPS